MGYRDDSFAHQVLDFLRSGFPAILRQKGCNLERTSDYLSIYGFFRTRSGRPVKIMVLIVSV